MLTSCLTLLNVYVGKKGFFCTYMRNTKEDTSPTPIKSHTYFLAWICCITKVAEKIPDPCVRAQTHDYACNSWCSSAQALYVDTNQHQEPDGGPLLTLLWDYVLYLQLVWVASCEDPPVQKASARLFCFGRIQLRVVVPGSHCPPHAGIQSNHWMVAFLSSPWQIDQYVTLVPTKLGTVKANHSGVHVKLKQDFPLLLLRLLLHYTFNLACKWE